MSRLYGHETKYLCDRDDDDNNCIYHSIFSLPEHVIHCLQTLFISQETVLASSVKFYNKNKRCTYTLNQLIV